MINENEILGLIYDKVFKSDIDYSPINIFLCGADTAKKDSIRNLLNTEFKKDVKFNVVYPEILFSTLLGKGNNLLILEDDLAKYVDVIVLPLEGTGTLCELGAFAMNKELLPKIIVINDEKYNKKKSFINLGPIDLIRKNNSKNIILYKEGKEHEIISGLIEKIRYKRFDKKPTYDLENMFNLSQFVFYLIAVFQPISRENINKLIKNFDKAQIKTKYIDAALQILVQKNRIASDMDRFLKKLYELSSEGHNYFYEEALVKLKIKNDFTKIRALVINNSYKRNKNMSKVESLLV